GRGRRGRELLHPVAHRVARYAKEPRRAAHVPLRGLERLEKQRALRPIEPGGLLPGLPRLRYPRRRPRRPGGDRGEACRLELDRRSPGEERSEERRVGKEGEGGGGGAH